MDYKEKLQELYTRFLAYKLCNTKGEFAAVLGIDQSHLSHALKGDKSFSARNLCNKAEAILEKYISENSIHTDPDQRLFDIIAQKDIQLSEKDKQIDKLLTIIQQLNK